MPPITTVASGRCTSAPAPVARAIGTKPREATSAVISSRRLTLVGLPVLYLLFGGASEAVEAGAGPAESLAGEARPGQGRA